jgi:hypothetical protein
MIQKRQNNMINYEKLLKIYQNYSEYDRKALHFDDLNDSYRNAVISAYKIQFGKKVKFEKAVDGLGVEVVNKIIEPFQKLLKERLDARTKIKENMYKLLENFSKNYEIKFSDNMTCVKSADSGSYATQGYGCNKYAKESLAENKLLLDLYGYQTEIRKTGGDFTDRWGITYYRYELWANITEFDYWMLTHGKHFVSVLNWATLCWKKGTNPKVYFPFLSDEDYEKSLALSRDWDYNITRENCEFEPSWDEIHNKTYHKG